MKIGKTSILKFEYEKASNQISYNQFLRCYRICLFECLLFM